LELQLELKLDLDNLSKNAEPRASKLENDVKQLA
jgi:hypothetical protein